MNIMKIKQTSRFATQIIEYNLIKIIIIDNILWIEKNKICCNELSGISIVWIEGTNQLNKYQIINLKCELFSKWG